MALNVVFDEGKVPSTAYYTPNAIVYSHTANLDG